MARVQPRGAASRPAIQAIALSKSFHHYEVLKEISGEVAPGECYALFGPNGAGKTTTLKVLATLHRPTTGRFEILGFDGVTEKAKIREALLLVAHGSYLYDDLTAVENLRFALALRGRHPSDREIKIALDRVGVGAFAMLTTRHFSVGMIRRLSIARVILVRPKVLLLDEPYEAMDEQGMSMVNDAIRETLQAGTTVFFTTHNRAKAAEVADRMGVLDQGILREVAIKEWVAAEKPL